MPLKYKVYKIVFADETEYVGITSGSVEQRLKGHFSQPTSPASSRLRGKLEYSVEVLAQGLSRVDALLAEDKAIRALNRPLNRTANACRWNDPHWKKREDAGWTVRLPIDSDLKRQIQDKINEEGLLTGKLIVRLLKDWATERQPEKSAA